jgi:hypothetical protein
MLVMSLGWDRTQADAFACVQFHYSKYLVVVVTNTIQECGTGVIFYQYFNGKIEEKLATGIKTSEKK